jgi:radical SAM superfamily enzyme YgiQ (UPF0313 family)
MKSKLVLYIPPSPWLLSDTVDIPLGILYLASFVRNKGFIVEIVDLSGNAKMKVPSADIYGIGFTSPQFSIALKIREEILKENPNAKIIVGGPHATALPEEMIKHEFDAVVRGEGELATIDILENGITRKIYDIQYIKDITNLPFPAWDLIDMEKYLPDTGIFNYLKEDKKKIVKEINMMATRGCGGKCSYCTKYKGPVRWRSIESVMHEVNMLIDRYKINRIKFCDDTLLLSKKYVYQLVDELAKIGISWRCLGRTDQVDEDLCKRMKETGCVGIDFGIETGSQRLLDIIQKQTTVEIQEMGIRAASNAGLKVRAQMMVGLPTETEEDFNLDKEFIIRNSKYVSKWGIHIFIPFPTCDIWSNPEKYGYKIDKTTNFDSYQTIGKPNEWSFNPAEDNEIIKQRLDRLLEIAGNKNIFVEE